MHSAVQRHSLIQPPKLFPYCIVWTPIPFITWLLPFIGHMGVCRSDGVILDFAGPYFISVNDMAFGAPARYLQLDPTKSAKLDAPAGSNREQQAARAWDSALQASSSEYQLQMYSFMGNNCHAFVAHFLSSVAYERRPRWDMVGLAARMFFGGSYVGLAGFLRTWLLFGSIAAVGGYFGGLFFLYAWLGLFGLITGWFVVYALTAHQAPAAEMI